MMADTGLENLARKLKDVRSLQELFSKLNFDFYNQSVNKDGWNEEQKASVSDAKIIAGKSEYRVYYVHVSTNSLMLQKAISSKMIKGDHGLCMVCMHNPYRSRWVFFSRAKKYSKSFAETRHVPIYIRENIGAPKTFVDFLENIRMDDDALTASTVAQRVSDAFDRWEMKMGDEPVCIQAFRQNCSGIISDLDYEGTVKADRFVSMTSKINKRHPFVFVPDFVEDLMNGMFTRAMKKKYQISSYNDFTLITYAMKFDRKRSKNPNWPNKKINLQNTSWAKQYKFLTSQIRIFHNALTELYNCNVLNSLVVYTILNYQPINRSDLKNTVAGSCEKFINDVHMLYDDKRRNSFEEYMRDGLNTKIESIIKWMLQEAHLTSLDGEVSLPEKYSAISEHVYTLINEMKDGISHSSLKTKILQEFPLLRIISNPKKVDESLEELAKNNRIVIHKSYWKYSPDSDQLFTLKNYAVKRKKINDEIVLAGRIKFFGRAITPDQFISELTVLEQGDLDDLDDQVTRIAGLVLSDAALLQSPRETMDEFDFVVDLTRYNFRPEQEKMMQKLDFQATASIFHCKTMINKKITLNTLSKLRNAVPDGEQAVIFTCRPVRQEVLQQTKNDRTVQIIDKEGIRNWCLITPTIPCRRNSVARVMYGDGAGKIVLIKSLNYESGLAIVETTDRVETSFQIGCLQEVDLKTTNSDDFENASKKYFEFVCLLANLSYSLIEENTNTKIIAIHKTYHDFIKSTNPELIGSVDWKNFYYENNSKDNRYIELDNTHVKINISKYQMENSISCKCGHHLNEEHYYTLCRHQVAAIDHYCRGGLDWPIISHNIDLFTKKLNRFRKDNIRRAINAIYDVIDPKSGCLVKAYLQKHIDANRN